MKLLGIPAVPVLVVLVSLAAPPARASGDRLPEAAATRHAPPPPPRVGPAPILKLSYARYDVGNLDGGAVPLEALHLDLYALSRPWWRLGVEAEAGRGTATVSGASASLHHGLLGVNAGLQIPGRLTPFVEGHFAGGVFGAKLDGTVTIPGTGASISDASAATWMYTRGVEGGLELYALRRAYVFGSLGWTRSTWGGTDEKALVESMGGNVVFKDITHDSFVSKLGLGF